MAEHLRHPQPLHALWESSKIHPSPFGECQQPQTSWFEDLDEGLQGFGLGLGLRVS